MTRRDRPADRRSPRGALSDKARAEVETRVAHATDSTAIARIYNDAVRRTVATFDTSPRPVATQRRILQEHATQGLPLRVAVHAGRVIGWASLSRWSERRAYAGTAEVSVYVGARFRGRGVGHRLLSEVLRAAEQRGLHVLLARVADGNAVSLRLHRRLGFVRIGVMHEVGFKFGRYVDVVLLERRLASPRPRRPPA